MMKKRLIAAIRAAIAAPWQPLKPGVNGICQDQSGARLARTGNLAAVKTLGKGLAEGSQLPRGRSQ
jgi:hypothetical protein